jgi:hypothetical protein
MNWSALLVGQLEFYWDVHLRPRLEGLTDEEYLWKPAEDSWSLRSDADGNLVMDQQWPEPSPPPLTTIAWRIMHVGVDVLATRASTFFGDGSVPADADMFDPRHRPGDLPGTAAGAVAFLERAYQRWHDGIAGLDDTALGRPLGPKGGPFGEDSMAALIIHLNREVMHHGGEIGLLHDIYRITGPRRF